LLSDGIYENFTPEVNQIFEADRYGLDYLTKLCLEYLGDNCCDKIVDHLTLFAFNATRNVRLFMETNPHMAEPNHSKEYAGKMDHSTCVVVQIGFH